MRAFPCDTPTYVHPTPKRFFKQLQRLHFTRLESISRYSVTLATTISPEATNPGRRYSREMNELPQNYDVCRGTDFWQQSTLPGDTLFIIRIGFSPASPSIQAVPTRIASEHDCTNQLSVLAEIPAHALT